MRLPTEITQFIVDQLWDEEALKLLQVNTFLRKVVFQRGIFPKHVQEIFVQPRISTFENGERTLKLSIRIYPRNLTDPSRIREWLIDENPLVLKQIQKIRSTEYLMFEYIKCGVLEGKVVNRWKETQVFRELRFIYQLRLESPLALNKIFTQQLNPKSVNRLNMFFGYNPIDSRAFEDYWNGIRWKSSFSHCDYFELNCIGVDVWEIAHRIHPKHVEFNSLYLGDHLKILRKLMDRGIPGEGRSSAQTRDYVFADFSGDVESVLEKLSALVLVFPNIYEIEKHELKAFELEKLNSLRYQSSFKYIAEHFWSQRTLDIEMKEIWLCEEDTLDKQEKHFLKTENGYEMLICICVDRKRRITDWAIDLNVILMPRDVQ